MQRKCVTCSTIFNTTYKGRVPTCRACRLEEERIEAARYVIAGVLRHWRERKIARLMIEAAKLAVPAIVCLLKQPTYARLLKAATPELIREVPDNTDNQLTSFKSYVNGSLLATLCARFCAGSPIPPSLLLQICLVVAAEPSVLHQDATHNWHHPLDFLPRGDPLFQQCKEAMLEDVRWTPDIHSLLPGRVKQSYHILARILWRHNVHIEHIFKHICSFLPPLVRNRSSDLIFQTTLEIANGLGVKITQALWEEVTLSTIATLVSSDAGTYVAPGQLGALDWNFPGFFELNGVAGVPELRTSGKTCRSIAFAKRHAESIFMDAKKAVVDIKNTLALEALGLPNQCRVAMTKEQQHSLRAIASAGDASSSESCKDWLVINDRTGVDEACEGIQLEEEFNDLDLW